MRMFIIHKSDLNYKYCDWKNTGLNIVDLCEVAYKFKKKKKNVLNLLLLGLAQQTQQFVITLVKLVI